MERIQKGFFRGLTNRHHKTTNRTPSVHHKTTDKIPESTIIRIPEGTLAAIILSHESPQNPL